MVRQRSAQAMLVALVIDDDHFVACAKLGTKRSETPGEIVVPAEVDDEDSNRQGLYLSLPSAPAAPPSAFTYL